jgi:hypothetical protein
MITPRKPLLAFYLFYLGGYSLCTPGWLQSHNVPQAGLDLEILLPQSPKCWDYRCVPPYPVRPTFPKMPAWILTPGLVKLWA